MSLVINFSIDKWTESMFCSQILCHSKEFLGKVSLIIGVSNDTKRKEKKKTIIGISKF